MWATARFFFTSTTLMLPPTSELTYARTPSRAKTAARGLASTKMFATTALLFGSMTVTVLLVSAVT
ncbi:MAG: hypothetical protein JO088_04585 [Acidobacteria bacterium]|nr:hypothetical protein [Acidobacteriota bacterium]